MHLTQKKINLIKSNGKRQWITDDEIAGLRLYIAPQKGRSWFLRFKGADGRRLTHKIGGAGALTVEQARDIAKDLLARIARGENPHEKPTEKLTLGKFLTDIYFPYLKTTHKSAAEMTRALSVAFKAHFKKPIENINPLLIEKWRMARRDAGLKAASINRTTAYLKAAFNWAFKSGLIEQNPIARISPLKERDSKTILRYLSGDERERLEAALVEREKNMREGREHANLWRKERKYNTFSSFDGEFADYLRPAVLLSLVTGIRQGALFALVWGDVNFDDQTILLRADDAKNGRNITLPICDDALDILSSWRAQSPITISGALIFPSPKTGSKIQEVKTAWRRLLENADIQNFRWHDLRHTFASNLVQAGVDLNTVRELMCHADMKMTLRYAHLAPENKLHAVQALNRRTKGDKIIGHIRKAHNS